MNIEIRSVQAIVVAYNPDWDVLHSELRRLDGQVQKIWLVDNASKKTLADLVHGAGLKARLSLVQMSSNMGLGAAQNKGIQLALEDGASHVLILDQDSEPMPDMVDHLLAACDHLQARGIPVAAAAPAYADSAGGPASGFVRLGWLDFKKQTVLPDQQVVEADFVISSGSLIPVSVFDDIGLMDESLFIDHVDTEWCLRAQSRGYRLFGVPSARMVHTLGDHRTRIWFLRWRNVPYHSPFRYYYILRNSLLMQRRPYMPLKWRVAEALRCIRMFFFYGLFAPRRGECVRMMLKGIGHGLCGVSGPLKP